MSRYRYELIGVRLKPKARPLVGRGRMYVPQEYQTWKASVRAALAAGYAPAPLLGRCAISIEVHAPTKPRGDLDNLAGGLLDAIQPPRAQGDLRAQHSLERQVPLAERLAAAPGALIGDDKQVERLAIEWVASKRVAVVLVLEDLPLQTISENFRIP